MNLRTPSQEAFLERAVLRVAHDETFIASALREWNGHLDFDAAAAFFACTRAAVLQLALCRRPDAAATTFRADVSRIASHAGVDEARLLSLLREVDAVAAFRKADGSQLLAAARDERAPKKDGES